MQTLDEMQRQFEEKLDARMRRRRGESGPPQTLEAGLERRMADYQARLEEMITSQRQTRLAPPPNAAIALHGTPALASLDELMEREFALRRHLPGVGLGKLPTVYCTTLEEFLQPQLALLDVSQSTRQAYLESMIAQAKKQAEKGGGTFGVFVPGRGCFLNGWLFAYGRDKDAPSALEDPQILPAILSTTIHEKMGHGLVSEGTLLGEEKNRLGAWRFDLADRFDWRLADTPESALVAEKTAILHGSSLLLEEGWATWVEHYLMSLIVGGQVQNWPAARYTLSEVGQALQDMHKQAKTPQEAAPVLAIKQAFEVLFVQDDPSPSDLHTAVLTLHQCPAEVSNALGQALGQPLPYVAGYLLVRELEGRLGAACVPYAVAIAANVDYDVEKISSSDLYRVVVQSPRLNVDSRLAQLRLLNLREKGSLAELTGLAHEMLNLALPEGLRV